MCALTDPSASSGPDWEELQAIQELLNMKREQLESVDHDCKKWCCQWKGCTNGTIVWDFGIHPFYFHPRKNGGWLDITNNHWRCGKHLKMIKHLEKNYTYDHIARRNFTGGAEWDGVGKLIDVVREKSIKINE